MQIILAILVGVPAAMWVYALVLLPWKLSTLPALSSLSPDITGLPRLSVVIAARNEADKIESALASVLAQDYPDLEVVVVDDRSTDGTSEILHRMQDRYPQLRVLRVESLPEGWLGKTHALQKGFEATQGEFVLFTDADVHFQAQCLRRALGYAVRTRLDHLVSLPQLINTKPSLRIVIPAFSVFFLMNTRPWEIGDAQSARHIGVGAFNLVRRHALERLGGFEQIRLRPDDDVRLGKLLKGSGARPGFLRSDGALAVEWYSSAGEMILGLEKNAFAYFDYRVLATTVLMLGTLLLLLTPLAGLAWLPALAGWIGLAGTLAMLALAVRVAAAVHLHPAWGILFPVGGLCVVYATLRSMWITRWRGGIVWRDTFYSLDKLTGKSS